MTLITKGMGAILKGVKAVKKEFVSPKTNIPLYVAGATVWGLTHARHKAKAKSKKKKKDKE
tara:strand:+ start:25 stop:207 length:183 start_codon:yes stop_codon:yes gene_type:complete